jgi:hypothetical protein
MVTKVIAPMILVGCVGKIVVKAESPNVITVKYIIGILLQNCYR